MGSVSSNIIIKNYDFVDNCIGTYSDKYSNTLNGLGSYATYNGKNCVYIQGRAGTHIINKIKNLIVTNFELTCYMAINGKPYNDSAIHLRGAIGNYTPNFTLSGGDSKMYIGYNSNFGSDDFRNPNSVLCNSSETGTWYKVTIKVIENNITVTVDGKGTTTFTDSKMLSSGEIFFENLGYPYNSYFADIKIKKL